MHIHLSLLEAALSRAGTGASPQSQSSAVWLALSSGINLTSDPLGLSEDHPRCCFGALPWTITLSLCRSVMTSCRLLSPHHVQTWLWTCGIFLELDCGMFRVKLLILIQNQMFQSLFCPADHFFPPKCDVIFTCGHTSSYKNTFFYTFKGF